MSDELRQNDYDALILEKIELERKVARQKNSIDRLVHDIRNLYQVKEEKKAEVQFVTDENDWDPLDKALEIWSSVNETQQLEDILLTLKRTKAATKAQCTEVTMLLKDG